MNRYFIKHAVATLFVAHISYSPSAFATDYYVHAGVGSNQNSGLQPHLAFAELRYAMKQLSAGDTLYVRSGNYVTHTTLSTTDSSSGSSTSPIMVKPYQNEKPVIDGVGITFHNINWWVIEGLTLEGGASIVFGSRNPNLAENNQCTSIANDITIRNNRFQHGSRIGINIMCGRRINIENNIFDNLRSRVDGKDLNAIKLEYFANDITISGNTFTDIGSDGIHLLDRIGAKFTDVKITDNVFEIVRPYRYRDENGTVIPADTRPFDNVGENAIDIKQGPGPILISNNRVSGYRNTLEVQDASGGLGTAIVAHQMASGITLEKNYIYDNQVHLAVGLGSGDNTTSTNLNAALLAKNNIFDRALDNSMYLHKANNVKVFNNTFYNEPGNEGEILRFSDIYNIEFINNVIHNGKVAVGANSTLYADHNAWSGVSGATYTGEIDPVMIGLHDVTTADTKINLSTWEPLDNSPLIDAGTQVDSTEDFNGNPVTGAGPDIGALEYQPSGQPMDTRTQSVLATNPENGTTVSSSGSGGGCTINSNAKIDPLWLFLMLMPFARHIWRRLRL